MAKNLGKVIILVVFCQVCRVTCVPLNDASTTSNTRVKRFPANNNFSFGFGTRTPFALPNPISSIQGSLNNLANILRLRPTPNEHLNMDRASTNHSYESPQDTNIESEKQITLPSSHNTERNKNIIAIHPNPQNEVVSKEPQNPEYQKNNFNDTTQVITSQTNTSSDNFTVLQSKGDINEPESTTSTSDDTKKDHVKKIDQYLLDYIFKTKTNTVDSTTEYTTVTGDYETTTYEGDELLRIPGPLVASLLG